MKKIVKKFLQREHILPINKKNRNWKNFIISHLSGSKGKRRETWKYIKSEVENFGGIYIYYRYPRKEKEKPIYIGIGKKLKNRLYAHYRISFEPFSNDRTGLFHDFWSKHTGKFEVYWCKKQSRYFSEVIEKALQYVLEPKFNDWKPIFQGYKLITKIKKIKRRFR